MPLPKDQAWFHAKTYGWGWGPPVRWQGWVVMVAFCALVVGVSWWLPPHKHPIGFIAGLSGLATALMLICWAKGEAPRWRWGND